MSAATVWGSSGVVPITRSNYDTTGSLTRSSFMTPTEAEILALYTDGTKYFENKAYLQHQIEMKACGVRRNSMYDLIMSAQKSGLSKEVNFQKVKGSPSIIVPYIQGLQRNVINTGYWQIIAGFNVKTGGPYAADVYTTTGAGGGSPIADADWNVATQRIIRVVPSYNQNFALDPGFFLPGHHTFILSQYAGSTCVDEWEVVTSAIPGGLTDPNTAPYIDVVIKPAGYTMVNSNPGSTSSNNSTPYSPALVMLGVNNVKDAEKWCHNNIALNNSKLVPFWFATNRWGRRTDSWYEEAFAQLIDGNFGNEYFEKFRAMTLAELNANDELIHQQQTVIELMFGKPISANQTTNSWMNLTQINSYAATYWDTVAGAQTNISPQGLIGYKANVVGWYEQLRACQGVWNGGAHSRVIDLGNQKLPLRNRYDTTGVHGLYDMVEQLNRARNQSAKRSTGGNVDGMCCAALAQIISAGVFRDYQRQWGDTLQIQLEHGMNETLGFNFTRLRLPDNGNTTLNLIVNDTFEDMATAVNQAAYSRSAGAVINGDSVTLGTAAETAAWKSVGRQLWFLDLGTGGTCYPATIASNRKTFTTGELSDLAKVSPEMACVMEHPTTRTTLNSHTMAAICEDPMCSLIVTGIGADLPDPTLDATA